MRKQRAALMLGMSALLVASCGVRVNSSLRKEAADAQLGNRPVTAGSVVPGAATGVASGGSGASGGPAGGAIGGVGGAVAGGAVGGAGGAGGAAGNTTGGSPSASAPSGGNGGPTDVGVSADSILL